MQKRLQQTEQYIKQKIAITGQTGFRLLDYQADTVRLLCPMAGNENHHGTMFGGSLAMVSIIAGYALAFLLLEERIGADWEDNFQLVIKDFQCSYKRPVEQDAIFTAAVDGDSGAFVQQLLHSGKAPLPVRISVGAEGSEKLYSQANYVVFRKKH